MAENLLGELKEELRFMKQTGDNGYIALSVR
jgi:hypothetical protein